MRQSRPGRKASQPAPGYVPYALVRTGEAARPPGPCGPATPLAGLDLSGAGLSCVRLPAAYAWLTELHLQKNSLRSMPACVGRLGQLRVLDLSYNSLEVVGPELGQLYQLRSLDLSCNRLTELPLDVFGRLCRLEVCKTEGNNITSPPIHVLQGSGYSIFRHACDNMSLPNPPDRVLHNIINEHEQASLQAAGHVKVSVVCYNVLAELYATAERHPYTPTWALAWSYRKMRLLQELAYLDSDIICLQEVETAQYHEFFLPNLTQAGYEGVFKPKSRHRTMGSSSSRVDGCAIFWKHALFGLAEEHVIEFQNEASQRGEEFAGEGLNRLILKDNIALVVLLELWSTRQRILVANTHIHWDPAFSDVKLRAFFNVCWVFFFSPFFCSCCCRLGFGQAIGVSFYSLLSLDSSFSCFFSSWFKQKCFWKS